MNWPGSEPRSIGEHSTHKANKSVRIKGKVEQPSEKSSALSYTLV